MSPKEAAAIIGCSVAQVRELIRTGKLPARRKDNPASGQGFVYELKLSDVERYRDAPQTKGWPRGVPRS